MVGKQVVSYQPVEKGKMSQYERMQKRIAACVHDSETETPETDAVLLPEKPRPFRQEERENQPNNRPPAAQIEHGENRHREACRKGYEVDQEFCHRRSRVRILRGVSLPQRKSGHKRHPPS